MYSDESFHWKKQSSLKSVFCLLSPNMAKLSSENGSEKRSQMALPSLFKKRLRGFDEALWSGMGWGILLFLFVLNFSSLHLNFIGDPTSAWSQPDTTKGRARAWLNAFWLMRSRTEKYLSLHAPMRPKPVSYFHCVKQGILGIGTVHGFGPDWVNGRSVVWSEFAKGFCTGVLGRTV